MIMTQCVTRVRTLALVSFVVSLQLHASQLPTTAGPAGTLTIASGEKLILQLETSLHTRTTREGDRVYFNTTEDLLAGSRVALPRGSSVRAQATKVRRPGRIKGRAEIRLRFEEVRLADGTTFPLAATVVRAGFNPVTQTKDGEPSLRGERGGGGNVTVVAQGGLQGAILGAVLGGRSGAAYGGAVGAGIGLANVILQRGPDLDLPRNTLFEARLDHALDIPARVAERAVQLAGSAPAPVPAAGIYAPRSDAPVVDEPVPDFSRENPAAGEPVETASIPAAREPLPPRADPGPAAPSVSEPNPDDAGSFKLSVAVQLVVVDALVRDRTGRPMDNLRREDFRLFEEGVEQTIRNFSRDELPLALALVIDRSGSVAPFFNELRRAAYRALMQLKAEDQVALFTFAGAVERLEELTADRQRIANRIAGLRAGGGTNIIDGLFEAVYYLGMAAPNRRRAVILISDNQATTKPRASESETIRLATETETVIYSIKTAGDAMPLTMRLPNWLAGTGSVRKVTQETGGEVIDVVSAGSLDAALAAAVSRLKLRYTLGYSPSQTVRDGAFRKIDVRLAERFGSPGSDYFVHARRGYYPPSDRVAKKTAP